MHEQTSNIKRAHKKFKGTKLEENNNIATMFGDFQNINLRILK